MSFYTSNKIKKIAVWVFWLLAIIAHAYSLQPVFSDTYNVNLSLNYALVVVAFIISITLYISSVIGNTLFLGIVILPIIATLFLFDSTNNPVNVSLNNFLI